MIIRASTRLARESRRRRDGVVPTQVTSQPWFTCEQCNAELQGEGRKVRLMLCVHCAKRCHDGHRGIKYLRTSKVACMCFECCDCVLMQEVEQKAREEGIVPLNKLARYEAEEVRRRVNLGKDVPAVLALLPERPEKERKKGYFGSQVEGWCLARRAEFTDPVDGWQILVDPQQPKEVTARRRRPVRASPPRRRRDTSSRAASRRRDAIDAATTGE